MKRRKRKRKNKNIYKKKFFERNRRKKRKRTTTTTLPTERSTSPPRKKVRMTTSNDRTPTIRQTPTTVQAHPRSGFSIINLQRVIASKHSFYYLEQLLVKHNLHNQLNFSISETKRSLRIELPNKGHSQRLVQFIRHFLPCRFLPSTNSSITTLSLLPFQPFDLAILSPEQFEKSGKTCGPFLVCYDYSSVVRFVDPQTLRTCEVDGKSGIKLRKLFSISDAEEFTVLNIRYTGLRTENNSFVQSDVEVQKTSELGSGTSKIVNCHFGHYLEVGDVVWGFDLEKMNWGDRVDRFRGKGGQGNFNIQVVLVRKKFHHRVVKHWKLMSLSGNIARIDRSEDFQEFTNIIAENPTWRKNVQFFKNENYDFSNWGKEEKQKGLDVIELTELMEDMKIDED